MFKKAAVHPNIERRYKIYFWLVGELVSDGIMVGIPIAAAAQRRQPKPPGSKFTRLLAWWVSALFVAGTAILLPKAEASANEVVFGTPLFLRIVITLWTLAAVLAAALLGYTFMSWRRKWWRWQGRLSIRWLALRRSLAPYGCIDGIY